jgi:hypothetical protein
MSDAKVKFFDQNMEGEAPAETAGRFGFTCPKRAGTRCSGLLIAGRTALKRDPQGQNGGHAMWDFDGNAVAPTFAPSINCKGCWHGFIEKGRCVDGNRVDEPEPA